MARRFEGIGESSSSPSSSVQAMDENIVYVAVGNKVEESKPTLLWALENFDGRVCILHVHQCYKTNTLSGLAEKELRIIQDFERQKMHRILDDYCQICYQAGVQSEKLHIEMDDVGEGIVDLIYRHDIKKLVIGAAANKHYSEGMTCLKSKKAMYVHQHVPPPLCKIWFICKGQRIHTREGDFDAVDVEVTSPSSVVETGPSNPRSPFLDSGHSGSSSSEVVGDSTMIFERTGEETVDQLMNQLREALLEAEKSKREAYEELVKRAEKDAFEANDRARAFENSYTEELRRRRKIEEELAKQKEDLKEMRKQQEEERLTVMDQKVLLENRVASCENVIKELKEMVEIYKKERDDLQIEHDNAVKTYEELLRKQAEEASSSHMNQFFGEFTVPEILEATCDFDSSFKIGEGGYGIVYQGSLRQTQVAIKVAHQTSLQRSSQFEQEVDVLIKLRHPNLVTFIGVCPELRALIYEYLPNRSLEDQLGCRANTPPLSWPTRIRIATDLCSVLIFLHSGNPRVVHGNLNPRNILLDANFACKLSDFDFGMCRALSLLENSFNRIDPQENFPYLDPQFIETRQLSPKLDIYSFGIILLQLLTGRSPLNIANDMQNTLAQENLNTWLDPLAGDWPFVHASARQLALLAVRCCDMNLSRRPDLVSDVLDALKRMRDSCESPSLLQPASEDHSQAPSYFICPILQDVMEDPHVAADGFTYELDDIRGWLNGHDTSPMTNLRLPHRDLVPNRSLRSAIQDWRQQHSNVHS